MESEPYCVYIPKAWREQHKRERNKKLPTDCQLEVFHTLELRLLAFFTARFSYPAKIKCMDDFNDGAGEKLGTADNEQIMPAVF